MNWTEIDAFEDNADHLAPFDRFSSHSHVILHPRRPPWGPPVVIDGPFRRGMPRSQFRSLVSHSWVSTSPVADRKFDWWKNLSLELMQEWNWSPKLAPSSSGLWHRLPIPSLGLKCSWPAGKATSVLHAAASLGPAVSFSDVTEPSVTLIGAHRWTSSLSTRMFGVLGRTALDSAPLSAVAGCTTRFSSPSFAYTISALTDGGLLGVSGVHRLVSRDSFPFSMDVGWEYFHTLAKMNFSFAFGLRWLWAHAHSRAHTNFSIFSATMNAYGRVNLDFSTGLTRTVSAATKLVLELGSLESSVAFGCRVLDASGWTLHAMANFPKGVDMIASYRFDKDKTKDKRVPSGIQLELLTPWQTPTEPCVSVSVEF